ncbi:MAG: YggS family pyridoxal phosphate-dependent enzyme [Candidatus Omnitrophica bacterium]|nr:YggS family pyridoxal phosphate-dependent enzyme [Candidatus Omnitrophota bacterium]MCF7878393.1 YggS family pyridoxal phosphate-dependent enzyme [Candidatus Omnitrophota bacterium]MCF7893379.1 YggS family pyridoxal phosphate-dependent enzyme [Candidatus Omnitrophota bacterium]
MIKEKTKEILQNLPEGIDLVVAAKDRSREEIKQAIESGAKIIGENYLKQAKANYAFLGAKVKWHFIGHLQKNKVRKAVKIFDMIETLDSLKLAEVINKESERIKKVMPVLIEVNSASEPQKFGVLPEEVVKFEEEISRFPNLKACGLMTMGPFTQDSEKIRPYFRKTKEIFSQIKNKNQNSRWKYLSMGMSSSYKTAIEEGANMIRVGTAIFGPRQREK